MKSKSPKLSRIILLFFLVGVFFFYLHHTCAPLRPKGQPQLSKATFKKSGVPATKTEVPQAAKLHLSPEEEFEKKRGEFQRRDAEKQEEITRKLQAPIHFYGRVVDVDGNPVKGAQSRYILGNSVDWRGTPTFEGPKSSEDGTFEIAGAGLYISVGVEHPDFYRVGDAMVKIQYTDWSDRKLLPLPTRENPVVFVLKCKGESDSLIYCEHIATEIPMDGQESWVDLRGRGKIKSAEAISFQLFSRYAEVPPNEPRPFDWRLTIKIEGGLVPRKGSFDFVAPEIGYQPVLLVDRRADQSDWTGSLHQEYFIKFDSGRCARVKMRVSGNGYCVIESWLNPKVGSRNLEFDPKKKITPSRIAEVGLERAIEELKAKAKEQQP